MQLSHVLLIVAVAIAAVPQVSSGASGPVGGLSSAVKLEIPPDARRSLRLHKEENVVTDGDDSEEDNDSEEERMFNVFSTIAQAAKQKAEAALESAQQTLELVKSSSEFAPFLQRFTGKTINQLDDEVMKLTPDELITIFEKGAPLLKMKLPGYEAKMPLDDFFKLLQQNYPDAEWLSPAMVAYTNYAKVLTRFR